MKSLRFGYLLIAGLSLMVGTALSRPVDLSAPSGGVGAAGLYGNLELWQEVEEVGLQLGAGSYLPLRYKFTSEDHVGGIFGPGFYVPMFEAKNVLIREQMMRAFLPCGKGLYLRRDTTDPTKFQTLDGDWTGLLSGDDFTIWRDDGWKLSYHKGRLTSLVTDDSHVYEWSYSQLGMPENVSENGQVLISVEPNASGQVEAIIFNGKRYEATYAERPITQILMGHVAIKELDQVLSAFKFPDGKTETFKFGLTPDFAPTLTFTNTVHQTTVYNWDAASNHLVSEQGPGGNWTYRIADPTQEFAVPVISRISSDNKAESISIDMKMGAYTRQMADGTTTVTHIFETPGNLYNKVEKIEKVSQIDGKTTSAIIYRASYDETGKLIRSVNENGYITTFNYNEHGQLTGRAMSLPVDPQLLLKLQEKGNKLMDLVARATNGEGRQEAVRDLAQYYLFDMLDKKKASDLISQLDHKHAFIVRVQSIGFDESLNPSQQAAHYQELSSDYPEYKERIDFLINATKGK
jgi:YD repeat-containing protein